MIRVDSLSKNFKLYRSPADRLKEIATRKKYHTDFQALNRVSFEVKDGETLGIIGQNGAGKSTLLKILTGILLPDSGAILINGKITGLLELGTGFNAEMTGIENIYMNGTLLSMGRQEIDGKKDAIIDFAELGEFIYEPLKTYSSGMIMRLAFAVAIHADPSCFVIDEALSVGDAHFQQKCIAKIREFRQQGGSIIFVSHDMNALKTLCDRALLLDCGTVVAEGDPEAVVNKYNFIIARLSGQNARDMPSFGTFEARIIKVAVLGEKSASSVLSAGENATISIHLVASIPVDDVTIGIIIRDRFGQDVFGTNTFHYPELRIPLIKDTPYECRFKMKMNISPGKYTVTVALHSSDTHIERCYYWADNAADFEIAGTIGPLFIGMCKLDPEIFLAVLEDSHE
jgi:lipopolysaccharide transport system ATP-binding protein